jgi:hypothetical protein
VPIRASPDSVLSIASLRSGSMARVSRCTGERGTAALRLEQPRPMAMHRSRRVRLGWCWSDHLQGLVVYRWRKAQSP